MSSAVVGLDRLHEALGEADFVVLACALTPETRGLIGAAALAAMRPGAVIVNPARGPVIDEAALYDALLHHRIGGAAIDTWWDYPPSAAPRDPSTCIAVPSAGQRAAQPACGGMDYRHSAPANTGDGPESGPAGPRRAAQQCRHEGVIGRHPHCVASARTLKLVHVLSCMRVVAGRRFQIDRLMGAA